ncbi:MAG TPA: hypothetical protein DDY13_09785 [Cytophagales bacterium]|jgi:probable lipoprotein NlpC|nr:hypothetical protein [Cytophagales bacterium]
MKASRPILLFVVSFLLLTSCATSRKARIQKTDIVVQRARSYIGVPYKYGGTTTLGMDCSGLLKRSFEAIEIYIPRTARQQSKLGKKVHINNLQPGDLVFFSYKKGKRKITHAGLVTDRGPGENITFIHASSSRGVIEANLMSNYYQGIFVKARRIKF